MTRKVLHLEEEIIDMKNRNTNNDSKEPFKDDSDFKCSGPVREGFKKKKRQIIHILWIRGKGSSNVDKRWGGAVAACG